MALILEDGFLPEGANSFVSVEEVRAFAVARASSLPTDDLAVEAAIIQAADFLSSKDAQLRGVRRLATQPLPFPRVGATIYGQEIDSQTIPQTLKNAQCALAIEAANGTDLLPTLPGQIVVKEKVGPLETTFSEKSAPAGANTFAAALAWLAPLLQSGGIGSGLTSQRI